MTGVLVWKVIREHQLVWLAMALLAVGLQVLHVTLLEPDLPREALAIYFGLVAYIYGLVVGAMLLAAEREEGTAAFLEVLPATRLAVWGVKCLAGSALVLAQVLYLGVLLFVAEAVHTLAEAGMVLGGMTALAAIAFAWGLFFSGRASTSMSAILSALLGQVLTAPLLAAFGALTVWLAPNAVAYVGPGVLLFCGVVVLVEGLLFASAVSQARLDRLRRQESSLAQSGGGWHVQWAALIWLNVRQSGRLFRWLAVAALAAGLLLPLGVLGWPVLTLILGVITGVAVFAGDQLEGASRFLGEQRLPPGKIWTAKVLGHLILAVGAALALLIPGLTRLLILSLQQSGSLRGRPVTEFHRMSPFLQWGPYLTLWLTYGFSIGCLFGLLLRKPVVAGVIAFGVSLLLVGLWAPSLLVGGLHGWQTWGVPVLLLATVRLLVWPWLTGQLGSRPALLHLTAGLGLAALWMTGAIVYRVVEIPQVQDHLDLPGFEQQVETARQTESGLRIRMLLSQIGKLSEEPGNQLGRLSVAAHQPWPPRREQELSDYLDRIFQQRWAQELTEVGQLPLGIVEDWQSLTLFSPLQDLQPASTAAQLLVVRGLQRQARGDSAAFLQHLAAGLALVRQLRHLEPTLVYRATQSTELILLQGLELWLARLDGQSDLLRRALRLLTDHDRLEARELSHQEQADYWLLRNMVQQPDLWVSHVVDLRPGGSGPLASMVAGAWRTPWEQARLQRLIHQLANQGTQLHAVPIPRTEALMRQTWESKTELKHQLLACQLMLALRLFEIETGRQARTLEELTPGVLESLPVPPGNGPTFTLRLSEGDEELPPLLGERAQPRKVLKGQAVLSLGGKSYIVPLPPGREGTERTQP